MVLDREGVEEGLAGFDGKRYAAGTCRGNWDRGDVSGLLHRCDKKSRFRAFSMKGR